MMNKGVNAGMASLRMVKRERLGEDEGRVGADGDNGWQECSAGCVGGPGQDQGLLQQGAERGVEGHHGQAPDPGGGHRNRRFLPGATLCAHRLTVRFPSHTNHFCALPMPPQWPWMRAFVDRCNLGTTTLLSVELDFSFLCFPAQWPAWSTLLGF